MSNDSNENRDDKETKLTAFMLAGLMTVQQFLQQFPRLSPA